MRIDLGETEDMSRNKARRSTDKLLTLLQLHHGEEEVADDQQVEMLQSLFVPDEIPQPDPMESWLERQKKIHPPLKKQWFFITDDLGPAERSGPSVGEIQRVVCKHFNVSREDMVSSNRKKFIIIPRFVAIYLSKTMTSRSVVEIARRFGGRDHTSALHAISKVARLLESDAAFAARVETIKGELAEVFA